MLEGENGGRNQNSDLLAVRYRLEGRSDSHFGLTESHVSADQTVHRTGILHVLLHRPGGFFLVGRILIHKGRFQFFLQVRVGREGKSLGGLPAGIQADQFLGNILHAGLGAALEVGPGLGTEFVDPRRLSFAGTESRNLMQGMDGNKNDIPILIH